VRTLSSKWLADGRCCTTKACEDQFNVGKGKAKDAEAAAASPHVKKRKQLPAPLPALALAVGQTLLQLAPGAFGDDHAEDEYDAIKRLYATGNLNRDAYEKAMNEYQRRPCELDCLVCDMPYAIVNVRRDEGELADAAFGTCILVTGTFCCCFMDETLTDDQKMQKTRWISIHCDYGGAITVGVLLKALAFLKEKGAHADDVARWSAIKWAGREARWRGSDIGHNPERTIGEWERMEYTGL
jgi:hypothetical protein